jgi:hypothetical protein
MVPSVRFYPLAAPRSGSDRAAEHRRPPNLVPCRQPRELQLDEVEIVRDPVEVAADLISLSQRELVFVRHAPGGQKMVAHSLGPISLPRTSEREYASDAIDFPSDTLLP